MFGSEAVLLMKTALAKTKATINNKTFIFDFDFYLLCSSWVKPLAKYNYVERGRNWD